MNVVEKFEEDDDYKTFLDNEYDAEVYANSIIASSSVTQTLLALQVCPSCDWYFASLNSYFLILHFPRL